MVISPDIQRLLPTLNLQSTWVPAEKYHWSTTPGIANLYKAMMGFDAKKLRMDVGTNLMTWFAAHELGSTMVPYRGRTEEVQFCAEVLRPSAFYATIVVPHRHYFETYKQLKVWRDHLAKAESLNGPPID